MRSSLIAAAATIFVVHASHGTRVSYADTLKQRGSQSQQDGSALYTKYTFSDSRFPLASCLDGGPGAVYVRPPSSPTGATKFKIFFQGRCERALSGVLAAAAAALYAASAGLRRQQ